MCGRNKQLTFILFSQSTKFKVSRACSCLLALVSHYAGLIPLLLAETRLFQLPTATVLLPSLLRLLVYLGLCNKEEDAMTRICELSKLAVSVAEGGAVTKLWFLIIDKVGTNCPRGGCYRVLYHPLTHINSLWFKSKFGLKLWVEHSGSVSVTLTLLTIALCFTWQIRPCCDRAQLVF